MCVCKCVYMYMYMLMPFCTFQSLGSGSDSGRSAMASASGESTSGADTRVTRNTPVSSVSGIIFIGAGRKNNENRTGRVMKQHNDNNYVQSHDAWSASVRDQLLRAFHARAKPAQAKSSTLLLVQSA